MPAVLKLVGVMVLLYALSFAAAVCFFTAYAESLLWQAVASAAGLFVLQSIHLLLMRSLVEALIAQWQSPVRKGSVSL